MSILIARMLAQEPNVMYLMIRFAVSQNMFMVDALEDSRTILMNIVKKPAAYVEMELLQPIMHLLHAKMSAPEPTAQCILIHFATTPICLALLPGATDSTKNTSTNSAKRLVMYVDRHLSNAKVVLNYLMYSYLPMIID